MALGRCRECGKDVSTEATTCPHCGVPSPQPVVKPQTAEQKRREARNAYGCLAVFVLSLAAGFYTCSNEPTASSPDRYSTGPFTLNPGYLVCVEKPDFDRAQSLAASGDTKAFGAFLGDQRRNGCTLTKAGVQVYAERAAFGVQKIRAVGSTDEAFTAEEAIRR